MESTALQAPTAVSTMDADTSTIEAPTVDCPQLLREWSHPAVDVTATEAPPVAPAVVLNETSSTGATVAAAPAEEPPIENHQQQPQRAYSYPVATFVSNFVQTTMNQIYEAQAAARQHQAPATEAATLPLSIRSEAEATSLRNIALQMGGPAVTAAAQSIRSVLSDGAAHTREDQMEEFVLVDGDLVAVPQEGEEMTDLAMAMHQKSCHSNSKARRGVKSLRKWLKKRAAKRAAKHHIATSIQQDAEARHESPSQQLQQQLQQEEGAASSTPNPSPRRSGKRHKNRKRRAWRRTDSGSDVEDSASLNTIDTTTSAASSSRTAASLPTSVTSSGGPLAATTVARLPSMSPISEDTPRTSSVAAEASFIGNAPFSQLEEAAVLFNAGGTAVAAEAYLDEAYFGDYYDEKKDEGLVASVLPPDADYKVDKSDAPSVDTMLRRAALEASTDLETGSHESGSLEVPPAVAALKTEGNTCPLSVATGKDQHVHNDILKVVMVGAPNVDKSALARAICRSTKKPRKRTTLGVDVLNWAPPGGGVRFSIWDVQGASREDGNPNCGAHPSSQSLFFSPKSLYLLVWDMAAANPQTWRYEEDSSDEEDDDDYDDGYEFQKEHANREADQALCADIEDRVLSWVECIAQRGPDSAILPVAVVPHNMKEMEAKRRCDLMQKLLLRQSDRFRDLKSAPKLLMGNENILCVNLAADMGIDELQETILDIATDQRQAVFDHVLSPVPKGTMAVLDTVRRLKQDHKLVLIDHLLAELQSIVAMDDVVQALHFLSSVGELFYFGTASDEVLSRYVILSRKWLVSALCCVLRNNLKQELAETRMFMNMQCIYSDQQFPENSVTKALLHGPSSSCPLVSSSDVRMLWQNMSFMRAAADRSSEQSDDPTTASTMFVFLERLLVHTGIFMPLHVTPSVDPTEVYFVPCLLTPADSRDVWTYKSSESWMTSLCHSWLFRDGAPSDVMEHVTVALLRDLYEFSRTFQGVHPESIHRNQTYPLASSSMQEFTGCHKEGIGRIKIHQLMCWKSSLLIKIGCIFADNDSKELRESFVEVFVTVVDQTSSHCVASDQMRSTMHRLIVSGKGQVGCHGHKLWKGGYSIVLDSIKASLADFANVDRQVVCPACLAHSRPKVACTWGWDSVRAAAQSSSSIVRCMKGHRVDSNLICGTVNRQTEGSHMHDSMSSVGFVAPVSELLGGVVMVGLWDPREKVIRSVGSGFVVDKKHGLIVTAGHVLFNMEEGSSFGAPYFGLRNAKVVIGVIPDGGREAVFRYLAEIVADDIHHVDAVILKIRSRMQNDVADEGEGCGDQIEIPLHDGGAMLDEKLQSLKISRRFELEESIRILGFNQGGEGVLVQGKHVNRSADFARGYICKAFKADISDDSSTGSESTKSAFSPREEIVIMCPTISGHSGGPCVNDEGKVVGILSRADPVDRQRCYLVPASEIKALVSKARKHCKHPFKMYS